jgi:hypothetical protein
MKRTHGLPALVLSLILAGPLFAAEVRFTEGPTLTDKGKLLVVSGTLGGLDRKATTISVDCRGTSVVVCRNEQSKVVQRKDAPVHVHFEESIKADMIAGGHAAFFMTSVPPKAGQACGSKTTSTIQDVVFKSGLIVVKQEGAEVLRLTFKP